MSSGNSDFRFGRFRLSTTLHCLYCDSEIVPLTPTEYNLLSVLLSRRGKPVEKDELMRLVWGDTFVDENNLAQHIRALRKKLGDDDEGSPYIQTLPRIGYCFREVSVRDQDQTAAAVETGAPEISPSLILNRPSRCRFHPRPLR
jgi:DNA-binding winged helix-turn-helix (wHTH) protein